MDKKQLFQMMQDAVMEGDREKAADAARRAVDMGIDPREAIEDGFTPAIHKAGELWEEGEFFLPELVSAAEAMKTAMDLLKPEMEKKNESTPNLGVIVTGTIQGDIHDIGKTLVSALLASAGFVVHDLGVDVPAETFIMKAKEINADMIGVSALLTTTMIGQKKVVELLKKEGMRDRVKVLVGGAPVSKKWAEEIGADAAPMGAVDAVQTARRLAKIEV